MAIGTAAAAAAGAAAPNANGEVASGLRWAVELGWAVASVVGYSIVVSLHIEQSESSLLVTKEITGSLAGGAVVVLGCGCDVGALVWPHI